MKYYVIRKSLRFKSLQYDYHTTASFFEYFAIKNKLLKRGFYVHVTEYKSPCKFLKATIYSPKNFINGDIKKYIYPYEDKINVYISDAGNYFPSQYDSPKN